MTEKPYLPQVPRPDDRNMYQWFIEVWKKLGRKGALLGSLRFGSQSSYTEFEDDGTMVASGSATTWDDMNGSALQLKVLGTGLSISNTENTLDFTTAADLADYAFDNYQVRHTWRIGSMIRPHIHWQQVQNNIPNFLFQYRWQTNGGSKTTAWTNLKCNTTAFTYTSGTLNQISTTTGITPPAGAGLSDVIQLRVLRDNANASGVFTGADPYTVTASILFVDIHIESDTLGSRQEYIK